MPARIKNRVVTWEGGKATLTQAESYVLWALIWQQGKLVTYDTFMYIGWPDADEMPDWWKSIVAIHICNLRSKLKNSGLRISNSWGQGFRLEIEEIEQ